jgi:MFS family permease
MQWPPAHIGRYIGANERFPIQRQSFTDRAMGATALDTGSRLLDRIADDRLRLVRFTIFSGLDARPRLGYGPRTFRNSHGKTGPFMEKSTRLLGQRRFWPLFVTQFLGAFNDNLFRTAMVILAIYTIFNNPEQEAQFSTVAQALFILPFFLLSAVSGQLADSHDKAAIVRIVKTAEIAIMVFGAAGILLHNIPLMLIALFSMGVHSTFFGPIKYAILPQHLGPNDVLAGTGLVEAGTYVAILLGTIVGGVIPHTWAAAGVLLVAVTGRITGGMVPPAPPEREGEHVKIDWNIFRASWRLTRETMHVPRVRLAIFCISFFWAIGALLGSQFPPLVKNSLGADEHVATLFLAIFSIGVALGSVIVNRLLKGKVSARYSPLSAIGMGLFVLLLWWAVEQWVPETGRLLNVTEFVSFPLADMVLLALFGIAVFGGMFVVPLYAFLTVTVARAETARTIAVNNIVNSGFMVAATLILSGLIGLGATIEGTLLFVSFACIISALIAQRLHKACD